MKNENRWKKKKKFRPFGFAIGSCKRTFEIGRMFGN